MRDATRLVENYYPQFFAPDLARFCGPRVETEPYTERLPSPHRRVRINSSFLDGWMPQSESRNLFFIAFYFVVLSDMTVHAHFPIAHPAFDAATNLPKLYWGFRGTMGPPSVLLHLLDLEDKDGMTSVWDAYAERFLCVEWPKLPRLCGISMVAFLRAVWLDPEFNRHPLSGPDLDNPLHFFEGRLAKRIAQRLSENSSSS